MKHPWKRACFKKRRTSGVCRWLTGWSHMVRWRSIEKGPKLMATRRAVHGDGTIYQRASDQRWVGSFLVEGRRKYVYGKTQREAREKLRKAQADQEQGQLVKMAPQTLRHYLEQWLERKSLTLKLVT